MAKMSIILNIMSTNFDGAKIRKMHEFSTFWEKKMQFLSKNSRKNVKMGGKIGK